MKYLSYLCNKCGETTPESFTCKTCSPKVDKFMEGCPAFARATGINDLNQWNIVESLYPFEKSQRFDKLCEIKANIERCLEKMDSIAQEINN